MSQQLRHDYFPPDSFGRAVQDAIGDDVLMRLRQALGGREVRIPRARWIMLDDHWLVQAVGREAAEELVSVFDGERVYIPSPCKDHDYLALVKAGKTNGEIAAHMGVTDRTVRRQLAAMGITNPNWKQTARKALSAAVIAARQQGPALIAAE